VRLIEDAPLFVGQVDRVLQALKYKIPRFRPIAAEAQCRQRQCVSGVVSEIETALEAELLTPGVIQPAGA
jgi:hypothetical protein